MRSLLSNDEKRKLLENFRSSGQTQAAFAEHNGINLKTFQKWLHNQSQQEKLNQSSTEFVEIKRPIAQSFRNIIIRKADIEIEIPSFDASSLKEILCAVNAL